MSLQDRFPNGAVVSRVWSDGSSELLAAFQYMRHAVAFARSADLFVSGAVIICTCTCDGTVKVFHKPETE